MKQVVLLNHFLRDDFMNKSVGFGPSAYNAMILSLLIYLHIWLVIEVHLILECQLVLQSLE